MEALQNWLLTVALDQVLQFVVPVLIVWLVGKFPWIQKIIDAIAENQKAAAYVRRESALDQVADRAVRAVEQAKQAGKIQDNGTAKNTAVNAIVSHAKTDIQTAAVATEAAVNRMNQGGEKDRRLDELEALLKRDYEN